ncbi:hypothetical protein [Aquisphaera insulae]|uniref:hypothetical protein n=1 Tax=Aquisphaera insulae TaxID=2712864 RepID=UPI0013EA7EBB|nr:hypothetical protein [Aquisphaera insulae]
MSRTARLWKGAGLTTLGGILLSGAVARGDDGPPLASQLNDLGRQALAQKAPAMAKGFFQKALELDPGNADATRGLKESNAASAEVMRVAFQDPAPPAPAQPTPPPAPAAAVTPAPAEQPHATLENADQADTVARQQLEDDVNHRLTDARKLVESGQPEAALTHLHLAQNLVRSSLNVPESVRKSMDRRIQAQIQNTVRDEERIVLERAETQRKIAAAEQRQRGISQLVQNQQTIQAMMTQFDLLMGEGVYNTLYNGGLGNISAATAPFYQARILSQHARSLMHRGTLPYSDEDPAPYAGMFVSTTLGFLAQEMQFELLKEYRYMLTMQDVARAAVPFPDDQIIEYPDAERFRTLSERRIARYGKAVDVFDRDPKTKQILEKLNQPVPMNFPNETPLEEVLQYLKQATQGPNDSGIPIYVDPLGLQEADRTLTSPVSLNLEGVPLKSTLRLMLKQLGLTYTVKDGYLMITSATSEDQQTEIRVYPVADLAIIPFSLMGGGGGGMGGMGGGMGGMGGMGGGMGGMGGGGMGGMGGGMGGMGGGMGMMSVPVEPISQDPDSSFMQKKSN